MMQGLAAEDVEELSKRISRGISFTFGHSCTLQSHLWNFTSKCVHHVFSVVSRIHSFTHGKIFPAYFKLSNDILAESVTMGSVSSPEKSISSSRQSIVFCFVLPVVIYLPDAGCQDASQICLDSHVLIFLDPKQTALCLTFTSTRTTFVHFMKHP